MWKMISRNNIWIHAIIQSASHVLAARCINACIDSSRVSVTVMFTSNIRRRKSMWSQGLWLCLYQMAWSKYLRICWFSGIFPTQYRVYTEWCEKLKNIQLSRWKWKWKWKATVTHITTVYKTLILTTVSRKASQNTQWIEPWCGCVYAKISPGLFLIFSFPVWVSLWPH